MMWKADMYGMHSSWGKQNIITQKSASGTFCNDVTVHIKILRMGDQQA